MDVRTHRKKSETELAIRHVQASDLDAIIALDAHVTGLAKDLYWREIFASYGRHGLKDRFFLVAEARDETGADTAVAGFIVGEMRAWEFGSAPCGWVIALVGRAGGTPARRRRGAARGDLGRVQSSRRAARCAPWWRETTACHLLFFRGEGMIAGPYIQLEKDLD